MDVSRERWNSLYGSRLPPPPSIVRQGPDDFTPLLNDILVYVPSPWVIVSDPDGTDDIAAIMLSLRFLTVFLVEEPYLVPEQPIFLTLLDVEYEGIRVTAYDAAGATAVATFPNVRVCWETGPERIFLP